jgi:GT2 family glycosyltransferase
MGKFWCIWSAKPFLSQANPLVSVIILNFNGQGYLLNCLDSVLKNTYANYEVILVDNASTDHSIEKAQDTYGDDSRLRIIQNKENLGFSGGNNIGFQNSRGEYVAFLNNDTTVAPDWLAILVDALENDSTIGLAQSLILNMDGKTIQTAGWLFSNFLIHKFPLCANKPSDMHFQSTFEISFASGASMIVRREIAQKMGLFDPKIPFFYDDTLLSLKTRLQQKRVVTVPSSRIRHFGGATNIWTIKSTTFHLTKSKLILLFDIYHSKLELAKAILIHVTHLLSDSIFCLGKKNVAAVQGNLNALNWSLRNFRYLWQNRLNHWSKTKISPEILREKFVRVKLPTAFYVVPSRRNNESFASTVNEYEKTFLM